MFFRLVLIIVIFICIAWPLYKLLLRCVMGVKSEFETEVDQELEFQAKQIKEKKKRLGEQCKEDIAAAEKQIRTAQKVKKSL